MLWSVERLLIPQVRGQVSTIMLRPEIQQIPIRRQANRGGKGIEAGGVWEPNQATSHRVLVLCYIV